MILHKRPPTALLGYFFIMQITNHLCLLNSQRVSSGIGVANTERNGI